MTFLVAITAMTECGDGMINCAAIPLLLVYPMVISLAVIVPTSIIIGLPLTALLARYGRDSTANLQVLGAIAGAVLVLVFLWLNDGLAAFWFAILGAVGGGMNGRIWGQTREALSKFR